MQHYLILLFTLIIVFPFGSWGKGLTTGRKELKTPPRIIRTCCAFGSDVGIVGVPFFRYTETTSIEKIGRHVYLGSRNEKNGIIYTCRGGFLDLGHLRDQADWTAYLHYMITRHKGEKITIKLGHEGGVKKLILMAPDTISDDDAILLSGRIAYDLSVWHEIATWYGVSSVPLIPERYSAFSVEDDYSNLMGVNLAIKAIKSDQPYEEAMTRILSQTLDFLGVVSSEKETLDAMEEVENKWWTRDKKLPSRKVLIVRDISTYKGASPRLVPNWCADDTPLAVDLPLKTIEGQPLTNFYELDFRLNGKIPYRKIFSNKEGKSITEEDFSLILKKVTEDVLCKTETDNLKKMKKQQRKKVRKG